MVKYLLAKVLKSIKSIKSIKHIKSATPLIYYMSIWNE
jgi:hypothetical protein